MLASMRRGIAAEYDAAGGRMAERLAGYLSGLGDEVAADMLQGPAWREVRDGLAREMTELNREQCAEVSRGMEAVREATADGHPSSHRVPSPRIDGRRDLAWNRRKVESLARSAVGKSPEEAGQRMMRVADMNSNAMQRRARSAVNGAENAGRMDAIGGRGGFMVWVTMADELVRDSHAALHGTAVPVDQEFPNGLMYPGDPSGPPEEVYNCRCTLEWQEGA